MQIRFSVDDSSALQDLYSLTPRQIMIAWTTAIRQYVEKQVEDPLAAAVLAGVSGDRLTVTADGGEIKVLWHTAAAV